MSRLLIFPRVLGLLSLTAVAEIVGCYLPWLVMRGGKSAWLLVPAAFSLGAFSWLLTLHPTAAGRTYAAYGSVYITVAVAWLWLVDGIRPSRWDVGERNEKALKAINRQIEKL